MNSCIREIRRPAWRVWLHEVLSMASISLALSGRETAANIVEWTIARVK